MKKWLVILMLAFAGPCLAQNMIINGVTAYTHPGAKPVPDALVVVHNGTIEYAGDFKKINPLSDAVVIDGRGLFLVAGFWNSHVHFTEPKWSGADTMSVARLTAQLDDMVNSRGFTQVFDVGELDFANLKALRYRINKGEIPGPRILAVGVPLVPVNGSPFYIRPAKLPEAGDSSATAQHISEQIKDGAEGIKLFVASSNGKEVVPMNVASAKAAVQTAHRYRVPVFAHPSTDTGVDIAIAAGVDVLAHVAPDAHRAWGKTLVRSLTDQHIAVTPTLKMFRWSLVVNGGDTTKDALMPTALQQLNSFWKNGGMVLFGTDVGYMTDYETSEEFSLMSRAGLPFPAILASLTTAPAEKFGKGSVSGKIAKEYDADLVLLSADPALDSRNFSKVVYTIKDGKIIYDGRKDSK